MRALLEQQARALALALPVADALDRALQQALVRRLPEGEVSLARAAADLHLSVRSLQRRLQQRGLSWRQLLERTRQQLAQAYLADSALQLGEIALLLGLQRAKRVQPRLAAVDRHDAPAMAASACGHGCFGYRVGAKDDCAAVAA
ncbi:hypothetical protein UMZ34_13865 [Halopseudomonas pachastrellae]|nr:hypothetical protein UMZ34_13865 [Halopseudomonas pachastrellae]